jgi:hypothetical protein
LKYNKVSAAWDKNWTSYITGAGSWDNDGTYTSDNSGIPTDVDGDGFATNVANGIQSLPANATITDAAVIVADTVVLPVSVDDPTAVDECIPPKAYYYLYKLTEGKYPNGKFFKSNGDAITNENIIVGYGEPNSLIISDMPEDRMLGTGNSDQDAVNSTRSFYIHDSVSTGIRGWQEIGR